eukprot:CAMPEP_0113533532 /NCGR_PEP_ID=MMETSP0015_2-20120614/4661_1 /TAXON_ID=2838 /ORGANISM="Odontella" /LENGTH=343 /DNA_ID=CAMNT_0000432603 /DNA_START=68 /DNA_END=1099 /DNA_ORIENTATION=+ /assembly_acc=CAM_ASM_000160
MTMRRLGTIAACCLAALLEGASGFAPLHLGSLKNAGHNVAVHMSSESVVPASTKELIEGREPTEEWELDCYSRPVMVNGKKLWEVLLTDSSGSFRVCETLPSNKVNSRELRRVVEEAMEDSDAKPSTIRFFRGAMFNMINIALSEVDVVARPSRCTFALAQWLEERNRDVYPKMDGYRATMAAGTRGPSFLDVRTPVKLPDALRGEKYAFVSLPLAEFREGGGVTNENIGVGRICPVDPELPADAFVQGVVILTSRANALASWLAGTEVSDFKCDLRKRMLVMETDIDNQYLMAKLNDVQRAEGTAFEEGKDALNGLHFVSVQTDEDDDPAGFWLLREIPEGL